MRVSMIVAVGDHNEIGLNNKLPWHIPEDLKKFKSLTLGHHLIMGRKTYESIGKPLPKRTTIILTRDKTYSAPSCLVATSVEEALQLASLNGETEVFICGGRQIYEEAFSKIQRLYLSRVHYQGPADTYLFDLDFSQWESKEKQSFPDWTYEVFERIL